ncbi:dimethylarginine dimethylaminohydrolase family protein [Azospirillum agricola]|uniref:dimethylarginine dimethylaminohydrolase family protein n=1 Tax=Azospirillum agricola TaxID=1720247 RepID=UPI000A0F0C48|nr:arginine deiminase family protein [Azospirillum agricola]SMH28501.1 N-Dimethylarginine dimethylaminohydrolase [Azospirillum lipoferum]
MTSVAHTLSLMAAEHEVTPKAVLIHNPVHCGALDVFDGDADLDYLLFRERPDTRRFAAQYDAFHDTLSQHVAQVIVLESLLGPVERARLGTNPNQVYTRDAMITLPWMPGNCILCNMGPSIRKPERDTMAAAAKALGLRNLVDVPPHLTLEGGDVIPFSRAGRRTLLIGYGPRTQLDTARFLAQALIPHAVDEIIAIELGNWRINLDGGFVPVAADVAVAHLPSLLSAIQIDLHGTRPIDLPTMLRDSGFTIIDVSFEESRFLQACNCFCLGDRRIVCYDLCPRVLDLFRESGITAHAVPGSELVKGTGGPRCMTRPLY